MRPFSAKLQDTLMEEIHAYNNVVKKTFDDCFLVKRCPCGPFRVRLFEKDVTFHSHCSWWWHSKSDSHWSKAMFIKRLSQNGHNITSTDWAQSRGEWIINYKVSRNTVSNVFYVVHLKTNLCFLFLVGPR